jgi:PAS domain S-box-containing protein
LDLLTQAAILGTAKRRQPGMTSEPDGPSASAELRERDEQYRSIFEATSDGLIIRTFGGVIIQANPAACHIYGYTRDELVGLHVSALIHPEDRHLIAENQARIEGGQTLEARATHIRKDGSELNVEVRGRAFTYCGAPHILTVVRDVTAQVRAELAVQEERQRLSRELHDTVSQALFAIGLAAETARALLGRDPSSADAVLEEIRSLTKSGLDEMRALIFDLRPDSLANEGLVAALEKQAHAVEARYQIPVTVTLGPEPEVPLPVKEALYRIAQEALHNAVKHAQPTRFEIGLYASGNMVVLRVQDNGSGFDPHASYPGHFGLYTMQERAAQLGGTLHIESAFGTGTCVSARIPSASLV